ncbi:MAG TPA: hypothetical protein VKW70_05285, partial [Terriglobia bacterium]|nr:hypothetical protein [Terriglobia bacterium]
MRHSALPKSIFSRNLWAGFAAAFALGLALVASGCNPAGGTKVSAANTKTDAAVIPSVDTVKVVSRQLNMTIPLPGELQPYEEVRIFPKVTGFVQWIGV